MINAVVVIVNWNLKADTLECLASLKHLKLTGMKLAVIVVDNASADGSVPAIRQKFPDVIVLENKKNLGFSGGNNIGIDFALKQGADFVWLLNNDTIVDPLALLALIDVVKRNGADIAGSKIYFYKGREFHRERYQQGEAGRVVWYAGGLIDWQNMYASHRGVDAVDVGQFDEITETDFVTGCSMFVSARVFKAIGRLDERFFLYLEDLDFCLRARLAGFKLFYAPKSLIWHKNAGSTSRPGNPLHEYYFTRNRLFIGMRYAPLRTKIALIREAIRFMLTGSGVKRQAVTDALLGKSGEQYIWKNQN